MRKLYVFLPCYNEADNIGKLLENWEEQKEVLLQEKLQLEIKVINDASTDKTETVVKEKIKKYSNINIIKHTENKGLSGGINTALNFFYENGQQNDLMVIMDGDNTQNPKYIHSMIEKINNGNDCVIASRYQDGARVNGLAKYREKLSDLASIYYKVVLNIEGVKDYTCGYRIYTYDIIEKVVKKFGEEVVKEKSFACMMELLYKVSRVGARFDEVAFELRYDNKIGNSKMKVLKTMQRSIITAIALQFKYNKKNVIKNLLIGIVIVVLPFILSLITNYSPTNKSGGIMHDCGIFSYIGYAMQQGKFMYTGAWDNKGPLLYFIYYIGLKLAGEVGVYIIEYIALLLTTIFGYKIIKTITSNKGLGLLGIVYSLCLWVPTNEYGNFSEVFAMPLITLGIYFFVKCIKNEIKLSRVNITLWGICCAGIALLRLNMLLVFLPLFIMIATILWHRKREKEIIIWLLYGVLGFLILIVPMGIYLCVNNALLECLNSAYLQILNGFNSGSAIDKIKALIKMLTILDLETAGSTLTLFFSIVAIAILCSRKLKNKVESNLLIGALLMIFTNLYTNSLSGAVQMHYFITFIPIMIYILALVLYGINENKNSKVVKIGGIILLVLGILVCGKSYCDLGQDILERLSDNNKVIEYKIRKYIIENSTETDKIQMIGGRNESVTANYQTKRLAPTRYNYLPLWNSFKRERKEKIVNEVVEEIKKEKPKIIMVCLLNEEEFNSLVHNKEDWEQFLNQDYNRSLKEIEFYDIYTRKD